MTLHPGDVVWLGTDGATEPDLKTAMSSRSATRRSEC